MRSQEWRERIEVVAIDPSAPFRKALRQWLPRAAVSVDKFHRRAKTFLSPSAKYEIYLQLIRGETTIAQAATAARVDRSKILRIRTVGKEAALAGLRSCA